MIHPYEIIWLNKRFLRNHGLKVRKSMKKALSYNPSVSLEIKEFLKNQ